MQTNYVINLKPSSPQIIKSPQLCRKQFPFGSKRSCFCTPPTSSSQLHYPKKKTFSQFPIRLSRHATELGLGGKLNYSTLSLGVDCTAKKIGKFQCQWAKDGIVSTTASDEGGDQDAEATQSESKSRGLEEALVVKWMQDNMGDVIQLIKLQCQRAKGGTATETGDGSRGLLQKAFLVAKLWLHMHINDMGHQLTTKLANMLTLWGTSGLDAKFLVVLVLIMELSVAILMAQAAPSWNQKFLCLVCNHIVGPYLLRILTKTKSLDDLEGVDAAKEGEFFFGIMKKFLFAILIMPLAPRWLQNLDLVYVPYILQLCLAKRTKTKPSKKPFDDLEGVDAANKAKLREVVLLSRGFLFVGPQGTGKRSLVLAMAGVAFFSVSASDLAEVGAALVGCEARKKAPSVIIIDDIEAIGARTWNSELGVAFFSLSASDLAEVGAALVGCEARKKAPSVIIIDDIEAIGARTWNSECGPALSKFVKEMDELNKYASVVVIAATNQHGTLDSDLMKSDKDKNFALYMKNIPMEENEAICYLVALRTQALVGAAPRGGDCVTRGDDVSKTYDDTKGQSS